MAPEYAELVEVLVDSARYGDLEDVHAAIEHGVDVNAQDEQGRTGSENNSIYFISAINSVIQAYFAKRLFVPYCSASYGSSKWALRRYEGVA